MMSNCGQNPIELRACFSSVTTLYPSISMLPAVGRNIPHIIDIVVVSVPRYVWGHEKHFVPPITGIHLAAITPPQHDVRVIHQQVEPVDLDTEAELVALTFFSGFAAEAYRLFSGRPGECRKVLFEV